MWYKKETFLWIYDLATSEILRIFNIDFLLDTFYDTL